MDTEACSTNMESSSATKNGRLAPGDNVVKKKYSFEHCQDDSKMPLYERQSSVRKSQSMSNVGKNFQDLAHNENFLIGRREFSLCNLRSREHSHVRITEVVPVNSALVSGHNSEDSENWKTPVKVFSDKRRGKSKADKKLSRRIRSYYKEQDQLIKAFEDIQLDQMCAEDEEEQNIQMQKRSSNLAKASFAVNLILLIAKAVAVGLSSSVSIISSLVDSAVDLFSGIIIWWTSRAMKNRNIYQYPGGRSRLEPIAIVILSVIMSLASFQLIVESVQIIVGYSSGKGNLPSVQLPVILIAVSTIVSKFILFMLCYCWGKHSSSVQALAQDHRNDVLSNIVAIVCGYLGSKEFISEVDTEDVKYIDPIGAILISVYILVNWWRTGYDQIKLLTGHTADPNFLSMITWICLNHHHEIIYIDTVRAFHFGNNFLVEVDIVLPEEMSLKEAHNIGESLQQKLEKFKLVERAFVHLDYEIEHNPTEEHKMI
ncbi:uncharacterized protein LOC132724821 isoform X1 [Ruditapes philippinarum]|uniref:uncharacterized protein LOC132724821 isoform X1 n=1 Tax=Ruditapes philippinarum TaxID=129788 RepID=UPI00295B04B5|nr:uncharacterized protein LOC132724821 isoform X1 [Ruditapes philippinarum]